MKGKYISQKSKKRTKRTRILLLGVLPVLLLCLAAWWFLIVGGVTREATLEAGTQAVEPTLFLKRSVGLPAKFLSGHIGLDSSRPGDYPLQLRYFGRTYNVVLHIRDTVSPVAEAANISLLSIDNPVPEDFIHNLQDATDVSVQFVSAPDMQKEGTQSVSLLLTDESGNTTELQSTLTVVVDKTAPVLSGVADLTFFRGQTPDYLKQITASDDMDDAPVLSVDDSNVNLNHGGTYEITYRAVDFYGNESTATADVTILIDDIAPTIWGVNPISLYAGSTVSYRSGIVVVDDQDENPTLTVDSSKVNLSQPGVYDVTFTASDAAGNITTQSTTVTVAEEPDELVPVETIHEKADWILSQILTDDMTDLEVVQTIFHWIERNCGYAPTSPKDDWMQVGYAMVMGTPGDCFGYYSAARLLLERAGIPNISVTRLENPHRDSSHYWNMVSLDGGETYYHFDVTPRPSTIAGTWAFCIVTDAYLDAWDDYAPGYYTRDLSLYPATPEELPEGLSD